MQDYTLVRDAHVAARSTKNADNETIAVIDINGGEFEHRFEPDSRVSKALETMSERQLTDRMTGGQYFFVGDDLVDFRDGKYSGFVQTDDGITNLVDVLGIHSADDFNLRTRRNLITDSWLLGNKWSEHGISVPEYKDGGEFTSELHFGWNPFEKNVHSAFMLLRQICVNGMMGLSSILNTKIPLINRWEEHLDIANKQIQTKVDGIVTRRLGAMGDERATVSEVLHVAEHADQRQEKGKNLTRAERIRLNTIARICNPMAHLGDVYRGNVFQDKRLAAQLPAHLTTFDVFNMATEIASHTQAAEGSSDFAMDRFANGLVFDRKDLTAHASRFTLPQESSFSGAEHAFFGEMTA